MPCGSLAARVEKKKLPACKFSIAIDRGTVEAGRILDQAQGICTLFARNRTTGPKMRPANWETTDDKNLSRGAADQHAFGRPSHGRNDSDEALLHKSHEGFIS